MRLNKEKNSNKKSSYWKKMVKKYVNYNNKKSL